MAAWVRASSRRTTTTSTQNAFQPAPKPPWMAEIPAMAMDDSGWSGALSWARNATQNILEEGQAFIGYPTLSLLAQRAEYRRIVETIATEMTRKWIRLTAQGDEDKTERIDQLNKEFDRLNLRDCFRRIAEQDGYFGRAHLYLDIEGSDDPNELLVDIGNGQDPTSFGKVGQGSLRTVRVVEAVWTYPTYYNTTDPTRADWYNPTEWYVMSRRMHSSRILRFVGREVPDLLKPAYSFGGLALTQMARPYVDNWLRTRQSVSDLVHAFSVFVLSTDLSALTSADAREMQNRID